MSATPPNLIAGFRRFREQHFEHNDSLYQQLVKEGQTPKTMVVACCDSRVDPALVFDMDGISISSTGSCYATMQLPAISLLCKGNL